MNMRIVVSLFSQKEVRCVEDGVRWISLRKEKTKRKQTLKTIKQEMI